MTWNVNEKILATVLISLQMLLVFSCKKEMTADELMAYVKDPSNGLVKEQQINNIDFKLSYWPSSLVAWQDYKNGREKGDSLWQARLKQYGEHHYLKLEISTGGHEVLSSILPDRERYSQMVNKLMFGMGGYAYLMECPSDTLMYVDSYTPRFYGVSPATQVTLIYENRGEAENNLRLELNDLGLVTGALRFEFEERDLKSIPGINLEATKNEKDK